MAKCIGCPATQETYYGEFYDCGDGCPDQDFDIYGGDCLHTNFPINYDNLSYEEVEAMKHDELYEIGSMDIKAVKKEGE